MTCKKFFRHLSNSCYESLPVFSIKAIKAFRAVSDLIARFRHAINKVNLTTTFDPCGYPIRIAPYQRSYFAYCLTRYTFTVPALHSSRPAKKKK